MRTRTSPLSVFSMSRMLMELIRSAIRPTAMRTSGLSARRVYPEQHRLSHPEPSTNPTLLRFSGLSLTALPDFFRLLIYIPPIVVCASSSSLISTASAIRFWAVAK